MPNKINGEPAFVELILQGEDQIEEFDLPADSQIKFEDCYVPALQVGGNVIAVRKPDNKLLDALNLVIMINFASSMVIAAEIRSTANSSGKDTYDRHDRERQHELEGSLSARS